MNRRGRTREIVDLIDFDIERKRNIVSEQFKVSVAEEGGYIPP